MSEFHEISPSELECSPVKLIGDEWMLVCAGENGESNAMTASWGTLGELWHRPVAFVFVRPQRYTFEFSEKSDHITLSFFDESFRDALKVFGSVSGRDNDKPAMTGLTKLITSEGDYFAQAHTVLVCRKLYADMIEPGCFIDKAPLSNYAAGDFHKMYVCEITRVLVK